MYKLPAALALRKVNDDDQAFLDALYASRREDLRHMPMDAAFIAQMIKMQQHVQMEGIRLNYPEALHLMIEDDGQPVGRVIIDTGSNDVRLVDIAIIPAAHRQGIARAMLQALQAHAANHGKSVSLAVEQTNFAARGLYLQTGFVALSTDELFEQMQWRAHASTGSEVLADVVSATTLASNMKKQGQLDVSA
ncbi:GNAT family N-acetyltransferase [Undibacterium sp. Ji42W]|uniref:GNAT family N-acetyltransferase n=1 Tax=Undibacterium sp. Ji42W TaxID=3413039 RepID=UPI003BF00605